jgi:hypothetical protein
VKTIFFSLFCFTIGFDVGPSFFSTLKSDGIKIVILSVFFAIIGLLTTYLICLCLGLDVGYGVGLLAGALTQTSIIGAAQLGDIYNQNATITYGLTYLFGTIGVIIFVKNIAPLILRKSLPAIVKEKMDSAKRIFYILDNCGEAVFDRVFMEPYREKITLGVRGKPAFNDVTADDLSDCGLDGWKYIGNGPVGVPGTILSECDEAFLQEIERSDLIIAKGQGNFETMNEYSYPIAFLFLAKCPAVTRLIGAEMNSIQVRLINL